MANKPIVTPPQGDLPENWTTGQIVAPSGTEVGLSKQHGYNYLMQLVNAIADGVTAINDAFEALASLGEDGKIPSSELPSLDFIPLTQKGEAEGVAELDENGKVPLAQLLAGVANGLATLDGNIQVPAAQIPDLNTSKLTAGVLGLARGGTGKSSFTANQILYGALAQLATPSEDSVLMQNGNAAPYWSTIATLVGKAGLDGAAKVQTGSYVGTGTYGASNPCSLTFDFVPKFLLVKSIGDTIFGVNSAQLLLISPGTNFVGYTYTAYCSWNGQSVSWYSTAAADYQFNIADLQFYYLAIG